METRKVETPQTIIGVDPGGTTGMAIVEYDSEETRILVLGQIKDGRAGFTDVFEDVHIGWPTKRELVSEVWEEHNVKGADREPIYIEGVQYALWRDSVHYQSPMQKARITDDKLKELGLWTPGKRHQMDALIHALVWLLDQEHMPTVMALSGMDPSKIKMEASDEDEPEGGELSEGEGEEGEEGAEDVSPSDSNTSGGGTDPDVCDGDPGEGTDGVDTVDAPIECNLGTDNLPASEAVGDGNEQLASRMAAALTRSEPEEVDDDESLIAHVTEEVRGNRKERQLDGAFAGYKPVEEQGDVLYDMEF